VQERAKELFSKAFRMQVDQKAGKVPMKRTGGDTKLKGSNRQKFSRRKQFVIACVLKALEEYKIKTWSIDGKNYFIYNINYFALFRIKRTTSRN
jgi:hypothetical protein